MNTKAQGVTEYALIIGVVAAALLVMQPYFKRATQSVIKSPVDNLALFGAPHADLMSNPDYARYVSTKALELQCDPGEQDCQNRIRGAYAQDIAIQSEVNPKYGALQSQRVEFSVNKNTLTHVPQDGGGSQRRQISQWEENTAGGMVYHQELNN